MTPRKLSGIALVGFAVVAALGVAMAPLSSGWSISVFAIDDLGTSPPAGIALSSSASYGGCSASGCGAPCPGTAYTHGFTTVLTPPPAYAVGTWYYCSSVNYATQTTGTYAENVSTTPEMIGTTDSWLWTNASGTYTFTAQGGVTDAAGAISTSGTCTVTKGTPMEWATGRVFLDWAAAITDVTTGAPVAAFGGVLYDSGPQGCSGSSGTGTWTWSNSNGALGAATNGAFVGSMLGSLTIGNTYSAAIYVGCTGYLGGLITVYQITGNIPGTYYGQDTCQINSGSTGSITMSSITVT